MSLLRVICCSVELTRCRPALSTWRDFELALDVSVQVFTEGLNLRGKIHSEYRQDPQIIRKREKSKKAPESQN